MPNFWSSITKNTRKIGSDEIEQLRQQITELSTLNQDLKTRIQNLEANYIVEQDEEFQGSAYRKVLVSGFTDDVINKVKAAGVIGGIALFGVLWTSLQPIISAAVEKTVERQLPGIMAQVQEQRSDDLLLLLEITNQGRTEGISELIQRRDDFRSLLQEFIESPDEGNGSLLNQNQGIANKRRESAILYALNTQDPSLLNSLFKVCQSGDVSDTHKLMAFQAILTYKELDNKKIEDRIFEEILYPFIQENQANDVSENEFLGGVIKTLSSVNFEDDRFGDMMAQIANRTTEPSVIEAITAFFVFNPNQWNHTHSEQYLNRSDLPVSKEAFSQLVSFSRSSSYDLDQQEKIVQLFTQLDKQLEEGKGVDPGFLLQIKKDFAIRLLQSGNNQLFLNLSYSSEDSNQQASGSKYYDYDVWLREVLPLFEGFSVSGIDFNFIKGDRNQTDQRLVQDQLWYELQNFYWDQNKYKKITPVSSVEMLRKGNYSQFLGIMSAGYYEPTFWSSQVVEVFRDRLPKTEVLAGELTGTNEQQDALWRWVKQEAAIPELKAGRPDLYLYDTDANGSYYYQDPEVWRSQIVPLFPSDWQTGVANPLEGSNEAQDALRSWAFDKISNGTLKWSPVAQVWKMTNAPASKTSN